MVIGAITLLAVEILSFKGGSVHDFAQAMTVNGSKTCIVNSFEKSTLKEFTVDLADMSTTSKIVTQQTGYQMGLTYDHVFSFKTIDRKYFGISPVANRGVSPWSFPSDSSGLVKNGKVNISVKNGEAITLEQIKSQFSKPLTIHWMLEQAPIIVHAKDVSERQFLAFAASAVGGKFVEKPDKFTIAFDPSEFRLRARKTIQTYGDLKKMTKPSATVKAAIENAIMAVNLASNPQLTEAFIAPGSETTIYLNSSGKAMIARQLDEKAREPQAAAEDLLRSSVQMEKAPEPSQQGGRGQRPMNASTNIRQFIDFNQPIRMVLQSDFRVYFIGRTIQMGNRPSRDLRF